MRLGLPAVCALAAAACAGTPPSRGPAPGRVAGSPVPASASPSAGPLGDRGSSPDDDDLRDPTRGPRALVFRAPGFPTVDAPAIEDGVLDAAFAGLPVERAASVGELVARLKLRDVDVLVLPYGSAFPVDAWPRIRGFLRRGGGLAVLGGAPFHEPVRSADGWVRTPRQTAFAHDLLLGPAEEIGRPGGAKTLLAGGGAAETGFTGTFPEAQRTWALTLRLAANKDLPDEQGTAGPRDAVARPLVHVLDASGIARGCPLLEIDHHRGDAAGARWVLATSDARLDAPIVRAIVTRALEGASELRAQPLRATVAPGEHASVRVTERHFAVRGERPAASSAHVVVTDEQRREVFAGDVALAGTPASRTAVIAIPKALGPGIHRVVVTSRTSAWRARTGFVVKDEKLFAAAPRLSVSRDWLRKDGKVFPVVGTTYMASDVHRKFLFEPNPDVWDADFADMQKRGINFVRTGLWTAWSRAMLDPGAIDESV
ncbi:MAG TPA: hypothetical protein VLT33_43680, partial [Labilithrix sp.]|nr:hypothetical protein [Labilithrix sp.]